MVALVGASFTACSSADNADINVYLTDEEGNPTPEPEAISVGRSIEITVVEITESDINIRTGAGTSNEIVGVAQAGDNYVLVKEGSSWNEIEYGDTNAYIYGEFCVKKTVDIEEVDALIAGNGTILEEESADEENTDEEGTGEESTDDESVSESTGDSDDPENM